MVLAGIPSLLGQQVDTITPEHQKQLTRLGSTIALMLVYGKSVFPISPILIHFLLNGCDAMSLHSDLVREWAPQLHALLTAFQAAGPEGDLSEFRAAFSTYLDLDVSCRASLVFDP